MKSSALLFACAFCATSINAATIHVPADQPTIQAGIDAAVNGDTVLVAPGTYIENVNFRGKGIFLTSNYMFSTDTTDIVNTIIDGSSPFHPDTGSTVILCSDEDSTSVLNGFTIRNGSGLASPYSASSYFGGGVACYGYITAIISNNYIHSNDMSDRPGLGGGVGLVGTTYYSALTHPRVVGNKISGNRCREAGSAIYIERGHVDIIGNEITHNSDTLSQYWHGAVGVHKATAMIRHNTFVNNSDNCINTGFSPCTVYVDDNIFYLTVEQSEPVYAIKDFGYGEFLSLSHNCFNGQFTSYYNQVPLNGILDTSYINYNGDVCDLYYNIYLDPVLCDVSGNDFSLHFLSPCVGASSDTSNVGALGIGCSGPPVVDTVSLGLDMQHVIDHVPQISWLYTGPDSLPQAEFDIDVGTDSDWTVAEMWDPGPLMSSDTFVLYGGLALLDGETYFLRLAVSSPYTWSDWYETSFRMNSVPSVPVPLNPINDVITGNTPTLWIDNSTDAEGNTLVYDFFVAVDTTYGEPDPQDAFGVAEGTDSTGWQVPVPLEENKRYWWMARAFDGYEHSEWTELFATAFFVNGTPEPPTAPQAQYPPDTSGLPVFDMLPTFLWSPSTDPDPLDTVYYKLEIATDSTFNFIYTIDSLDSSPFTLTDSLQFGTHYWWRVTAFDNTGLSTMSSNTPDFWTWTLGDLDHSHTVNIADLTRLVDYLFLGGPPLYPAFIGDIDGDCSVNVADLTYLVEYLFFSGPAPKVGCACG